MSELLGILMAVVIATMALPKVAAWQVASHENKLLAITAHQEKEFDTAVSAYAQQYATALQTAATATTPATITVAMLQATNLLTPAFSATNPFGQTWQAQVLQPTAGNLQVLAYSTGGRTLTDTQINKISMLVPGGGFIPSNDSGAYPSAAANAIGAGASWNVSMTGYTGIAGGHVAALYSVNQGQLMNSYLYRNAVPGQPQLNQMNTPLVMAATAVAGAACTQTGGIAQDGAGSVLSCLSSGVWAAVGGGSWKAPVASFAALPATGNTVGDVRLTNDVQRAYAWNGASWIPLAIDQNGNISIPGTATIRNVAVTGTATVGAACTPNGLIAQDGTGAMLSCQSGVWRSTSTITPSTVTVAGGFGMGGAAYAGCPAGRSILSGGVQCNVSWWGTTGAFVQQSYPLGNGWYGQCWSTGAVATQAIVTALCN